MLRGLLGQLTDQMFLPKANKTLIGLINLHITMRVHRFFARMKRHEMKHKKCKTSIFYMSILDIVRSGYIVSVNRCNNTYILLIEILKYLALWLTRINTKECRWNYWHTKYLLDTTDLLASIKSCFSVRVNHHFHHVLSLHLSKPVKTAWMIAVSLHSSSVFLWTLIIISICVELRIYLTIHLIPCQFELWAGDIMLHDFLQWNIH